METIIYLHKINFSFKYKFVFSLTLFMIHKDDDDKKVFNNNNIQYYSANER
jgi:hypothetical protein